jgi:hypothetical protein
MIQSSLRSKEAEEAYKRVKESGTTGDIATIKAATIGGLKLLHNQYPYDAFHKDNDMIIGGENFYEFWTKLGALIAEGKLPYDQLIWNFPQLQSQPHVQHAHLLRLKDREDFRL